MYIGNNIRRIRELLGISQRDFAKLLKLSKPTIGHIENKEIFSDKAIDRIARALEVPPDLIITFDEKAIFRFYLDNIKAAKCDLNYQVSKDL